MQKCAESEHHFVDCENGEHCNGPMGSLLWFDSKNQSETQVIGIAHLTWRGWLVGDYNGI